MLVVQRVLRAKRTNLHEKYDYPLLEVKQLTQALVDEINAHLGEKGLLMRSGTIVDAPVIAASSSPKNAKGELMKPDTRETGWTRPKAAAKRCGSGSIWPRARVSRARCEQRALRSGIDHAHP